MENISKVVIWGDSVAKGIIYDDKRGRYAILPDSAASIFTEKTGIPVLNRAKMGMTVEPGLALLNADIDRGVAAGADHALIEFGGNDSDFDWAAIAETPDAEHLPRTPLDIFEKSLRQILDKLRLSDMTATLVSLPPIVAQRYFDFFTRNGLSKENILRWLGDVGHIYRFHEQYSLLISRIAKEYNCRLIDIRSAFLSKADREDYFCEDGIHPNERGQRLIGDTLINAVC